MPPPFYLILAPDVGFQCVTKDQKYLFVSASNSDLNFSAGEAVSGYNYTCITTDKRFCMSPPRTSSSLSLQRLQFAGQTLQQRIPVTYCMSIHWYFGSVLESKWSSVQALFATRTRHIQAVEASLESLSRVDLMLLEDPYTSIDQVRNYQTQMFDDVETARARLAATERELIKQMRRLYVMLNLNVPVDITGY